ncbi:MAG TPA: helix-turn-helix domain-containing protein [Acidimicrobiales bacterium]|nr:helix-turn-helix domain-containing protein [Acidimicrobiales bacterium]
MADKEATSIDRRRERSRRTRRTVVAAATDLFVRDGYGATSIASVASRAGVAVQTVYATFGTKAAILDAALDVAIAGDDEDVAVNDRDWMHTVFHAPTGTERLAAYAAACRRIHANAADVFRVVEMASTSDPAVVELAGIVADRRRRGAASVVAAVVEVAALRPGLSPGEAVDVLWLLNSPGTFHLLVREGGWSLDHFEHWLAGALQRELLAPAVG